MHVQQLTMKNTKNRLRMAFIDICDSECGVFTRATSDDSVLIRRINLFVVLAADAGVLVSNVDVQLLGTLDDGLK